MFLFPLFIIRNITCLPWLDHLGRREEDRMPKRVFTQELEGTKRRGRPWKRLKEEVERDRQVLGVRRWRELVTETNGRTFFDRPKPTTGCRATVRRRSPMGRCFKPPEDGRCATYNNPVSILSFYSV